MSSSSYAFGLTECKCGLSLMTLTSWTCDNPARRFGVWPNKYDIQLDTLYMGSIVNLVVAQEDSKSQASSSQAGVQTSDTHVSTRMDQLQSAQATKQSGKYLSRYLLI
ncbi:hypothetical protein Tco_0379702 [Tanacetum coccineum]